MKSLEENINYTFKNKELLKRALTHTSYAYENGVQSNEKLEFLGDSILEFLSSIYIYQNYPKLKEGEMTKVRATVVCEDSLFKIAQKLKAQPFKLPILGDEITEFLKDRKETTKIAGILNITPDSFSDGGMYFKPIDAEKHLIKLIEDGADLIDIGAESTRPFAEAVSAEEQIIRLKPVLEFINKEKPELLKDIHILIQQKILKNWELKLMFRMI